jgi:hypothetical protein
MKKITLIFTAVLFAASVTVFGQTQKPAEKKDAQKTTTTTTTTTTTVKQEPAKPATTVTTQEAVKKDQKTRIVIPATELPKAAQDYITKMHPGKKIEQAVKVTDEKGIVTYKADVAGMIMHFDANGKFAKETTKVEKAATETKTTTTTTTKTEPAAAPATAPAPTKKTTEPAKK